MVVQCFQALQKQSSDDVIAPETSSKVDHFVNSLVNRDFTVANSIQMVCF